MGKAVFAALGAVVSMACAPAAQALCWSPAAVHAARMRQLDVLLMVGSLRCRAGHDDYRADYDRFLLRHRSELGAANRAMLSEFGTQMGSRGAADALDRMSVTIANGYGSGGGYECSDLHTMAADLANSNTASLHSAADGVIAEKVVTPACVQNFASRR